MEIKNELLFKVNSKGLEWFSLLATLNLGIKIFFWEANITNRGEVILKNTLCALCVKGWGFHLKPVFFFHVFSSDKKFNNSC